MSDTNLAMRYVGLVALIAVFSVSMISWDASAPQVNGWASLQAAISSDPWANVTWPDWGDYTNYSSTNETGDECGWDLGCVFNAILTWMSNAVNWFFGAVSWLIDTIGTLFIFIFEGLAWIANVVVSFFGSLFQTASLTYADMPSAVQSVMWVIIAPLIALVLFIGIRWVRGSG